MCKWEPRAAGVGGSYRARHAVGNGEGEGNIYVMTVKKPLQSKNA